jgi:hypothetical protein
MLQAGRSRDRFPKRSLDVFSSNLPGILLGKGRGSGARPARKANNLKMWEPGRLTDLRASTARYSDSFTPFLLLIHLEYYCMHLATFSSVLFSNSFQNSFPHSCFSSLELFSLYAPLSTSLCRRYPEAGESFNTPKEIPTRSARVQHCTSFSCRSANSRPGH